MVVRYLSVFISKNGFCSGLSSLSISTARLIIVSEDIQIYGNGIRCNFASGCARFGVCKYASNLEIKVVTSTERNIWILLALKDRLQAYYKTHCTFKVAVSSFVAEMSEVLFVAKPRNRGEIRTLSV